MAVFYGCRPAGRRTAINWYMALFVNDKSNATYRLPASKVGGGSTVPGVGTFSSAWQRFVAPLAALVGVAVSCVLLLIVQRGSLLPLALFIGIFAAFFLARFWGAVAGGLYVGGWLCVLHFVPAFASGNFAFARGWESALLCAGAVCAGTLHRVMQARMTRLQSERAVLRTEVALEKARQQSFLRDVLSTVTGHRLTLCETIADLPAPLPFAPGEEPVPLASAMLSEVRSRIRKAGSFARLSESVTGDLVIAGSEASLNAVVHAAGGVAEIRADPRGCLQVWVRDCGAGIDDAFLHRAILEAGFSSKGTLGQGFSLIVSTCHRVYLLTDSTGTTIVLETEPRERFASLA